MVSKLIKISLNQLIMSSFNCNGFYKRISIMFNLYKTNPFDHHIYSSFAHNHDYYYSLLQPVTGVHLLLLLLSIFFYFTSLLWFTYQIHFTLPSATLRTWCLLWNQFLLSLSLVFSATVNNTTLNIIDFVLRPLLKLFNIFLLQ